MHFFDVVIIGGGPAGTGILLNALKEEKSKRIFDKNIALIEKSSDLIKGNITSYKVNSDTFADVFLECLDGATHEYINIKSLQPEILNLQNHKGNSIPLYRLNDFYNKLGVLLKESLTLREKCSFYLNTCVERVSCRENGTFEIFFENQNRSIAAKKIIIATGGKPRDVEGKPVNFAAKISLDEYKNKYVHADLILKDGIPDKYKTELKRNSKVVILGGSHSAFSVAHSLLNSKDEFDFEQGDIKIWCKSLPKIFFPSEQDAITSGYTDFSKNDFCPVTNKLYRLAGLRMDGRGLYMQMLGLGNSNIERRVLLNIFNGKEDELLKDLNQASLIILAYGYVLNMIPFSDKTGNQIKFFGEKTNCWVNQNCEMLDADENPIPNLFANGLATGFIPTGNLGGEPSFTGQTNGIWYYQNAIAAEIISNL